MSDEVRDLAEVLEDLETVVREARSVPLSASVMINREDTLDFIEEIRECLPQQIHLADSIVTDAQEVEARAQETANEIVATARQRAEHLVSREQIVADARAQAQQIVLAAHEQARQMSISADRYSDESLAQLQVALAKLTEQVGRGREVFSQRLAQSQPEGGDEQAAEAGQ